MAVLALWYRRHLDLGRDEDVLLMQLLNSRPLGRRRVEDVGIRHGQRLELYVKPTERHQAPSQYLAGVAVTEPHHCSS